MVGSFIETIPKRGYRFVADVREVSDPSTGSEAQALPTANPTGKKWHTLAFGALALVLFVPIAVLWFGRTRTPYRQSLPELQLRERSHRIANHDGSVIHNLLKLRGGFAAFVQRQVRVPACVGAAHRTGRAKIVRNYRLEEFDGFCRIVAIARQQLALRFGRLRARTAYHFPECAPPSTCITSPVTWRATVR